MASVGRACWIWPSASDRVVQCVIEDFSPAIANDSTTCGGSYPTLAGLTPLAFSCNGHQAMDGPSKRGPSDPHVRPKG